MIPSPAGDNRSMKLRSFAACLLFLAFVLGGTGCAQPIDENQPPPPITADGHVPATLLIVVDPSGQLSADELTDRRHGIVSYLVDHGYIRSGDDLVSNSADAEQIIQATLADDGSFELNIYDATQVAHREIYMDPSGNPEYVFYPGDIGYDGDGFNPFYLAIVPVYPIWHERHWNPHDHGHDRNGYESHRPPPIKHGPPPQLPHHPPGNNHDQHPQPPGPGHKPDDDHGHGGPPDHKPGPPPPPATNPPPSGQQGNRSGQPYPNLPPPPRQPNNTHPQPPPQPDNHHPQPPPPNGNGKPDNHPPSDQQGNHNGQPQTNQPPPQNPKPASPPPSNNKPVNIPPARSAPPPKAPPPPPKAAPPPPRPPPPPPPKNDDGGSDNTQGKTQQR
jgi:hypothetical protein